MITINLSLERFKYSFLLAKKKQNRFIKMKKNFIFLICAFLILLSVSVSAILEIEKKPVNDVIITELSQPALFNFDIKNIGESDNFEIYSLVGVDMSPKGMFQINSGETKNLDVGIYPSDRLKKRAGILTFNYKIRGQNTGIQEDTLTITIIDLKDAIEISTGNINPESQEASIYLENKINFNFPEINIKLDSAFFSSEQKFSLKGLEKKEIRIPVDKEKMKKLVAGQYMLTSELEVEKTRQRFESTVKFVEKSGLSTKEKSSGILFREKIIEKTNEGNVPVIAEIKISQDIVSRLFTTFSVEPDKSERNLLTADYVWLKELKPNETLIVKTNTNYLYPLIMLIAILLGVVLIRLYTLSPLILDKRVNYVKTKGGEFALKVSLSVKARKFVEKISVFDRLPAIVKLYERFGTYAPSKYDEKTRRLEWDIESLQEGEERIFSYIVYSKVGIVGKFELPSATAIYERDGKIKETSSNVAFFMNEPRKRIEE